MTEHPPGAGSSDSLAAGGRLIDFHTHLLPEMDDGSRSGEESLAMMEQSVKQGVCCMVLTPHFYAASDYPARFLTRRENALRRLNQYRRSPMPVLIPGAEVQYFSGITAMEELPRLCMDKTDLLLLEMPFRKWTSRVVDDVLELNSRRNLRIVIAHIERYMQEQPRGTVEELVGNHVLIQSNTEFFVSRSSRRKALHMLENGLIHLVGSDCHNLHARPPQMGECFRIIREKAGMETAERLQARAFRLLLQEADRQKSGKQGVVV